MCVVVGQVISHVLSCLETIDKQNFDKVDTSSSIDVLYHKLFAGRQTNKDENEVRYRISRHLVLFF
jgi:hypothetical protein